MVPAPLPRPLSSFVGRRSEIEELGALLAHTRLLTLVGSPGCGKTRLALEVAAMSAGRFAVSVAFVDLTSVLDHEAVADAAAAALDVRAQSISDLARTIGNAPLLLIIDNAEQVIAAVCSLAEHLLKHCANLRVVVTSREVLNIDGEVRWPVEPLLLPGLDVRHPELLLECDSVELFRTRVSEQQPDFRLTAANAGVVASICRQLDGIPLAIELAAARAPALGLSTIADRLRDSLGLLASGRRNAVSRHRTMRAAIDWSYDLLDAHERVLLRRLSRFTGTFDLKAVDAVCADDNLPRSVVADTISRLVAKSLVLAQSLPDGGMRYRQLEVIRQHADEQLTDAEALDLAARHATHYAAIAEEINLAGGDFDARLQAMTAEYPNIELALDVTSLGNPVAEAAFIENVHWYWWVRGMLAATIRRFQSVLAKDGIDNAVEARLRLMLATAAEFRGDHELMVANVDQACAIADETQSLELNVWVNHSRSMMLLERGESHAAERVCRQLIDSASRLPDSPSTGNTRMHAWPPTRTKSVMNARNNLAMSLLSLGRNAEALREAELAVEAARGLFEGRSSLTQTLDTCGRALLALGRTNDARRQFYGALNQAVENAAAHFAISPLFGLARVAAADRDHAKCLTFLAAARRAAELSGTRWTERNRQDVRPISDAEAASRAALPPELAAAAWDRGFEMDPRGALEFARDRSSPTAPPLSSREWDVVQLVAQGLTDKEIARRLSISGRTVEVHLARVRQKLGLHNRAEVAAWVVREARA